MEAILFDLNGTICDDEELLYEIYAAMFASRGIRLSRSDYVENLAGLSDAGYRAAQLAAGLAEGRLHLAAYALGASASGMTFLDSEVPALLGEPRDALLFTCVGVPLYRSAPGGSPGAPATVRRVTPITG